MTDSVDSMLFRNVTWQTAFDAAMDAAKKDPEGKIPVISYRKSPGNEKQGYWEVGSTSFTYEEKKINIISAIFRWIIQFFRRCFDKDYKVRFEGIKSQFKLEYEATQTKVINNTPKRPKSDPSPVSTTPQVVSNDKTEKEIYENNCKVITSYKKGYLAVVNGKLELSDKTPSDAELQEKIVAILKSTHKKLEEEIASPQGRERGVELLKKKSDWFEGLRKVSFEFSRLDTILTCAQDLIKQCNESRDFDALANFQAGQGYNIVSKDDILESYSLTKTQEKPLNSEQQKKFNEIIENVLTINVTGALVKREDQRYLHGNEGNKFEFLKAPGRLGRLLNGLYNILGYAHAHNYELVKNKVIEKLKILKPDLARDFEANQGENPFKKLSDQIQIISHYTTSDKSFLKVEDGKLNYVAVDSFTKDSQDEIGKWIKAQVEELWTLFKQKENEQHRGILLEIGRRLAAGLQNLAEDYATYLAFAAEINSVKKSLLSSINTKENDLNNEARQKIYNNDIQGLMESGCLKFEAEKVRSLAVSLFGQTLTDLVLKDLYGEEKPKGEVSRASLCTIFRDLGKEMTQQMSKKLVEETYLLAEANKA